jgi:hypothetical protein
MVLPFISPAVLIVCGRGSGRGEEPAGKSPPPDSNPFSGPEFGKNPANLSRQFFVSANHGFEFEKRRQFFIGTHDETLSVVVVRVNNRGRFAR